MDWGDGATPPACAAGTFSVPDVRRGKDGGDHCRGRVLQPTGKNNVRNIYPFLSALTAILLSTPYVLYNPTHCKRNIEKRSFGCFEQREHTTYL